MSFFRKYWKKRDASATSLSEAVVKHEEDIATIISSPTASNRETIAVDIYEETTTELAIDKLDSSWYIWRLVIALCFGGLLYGFDTGSIGGVIADIEDSLGEPLTTKEKELIVSLTFVGAILGCLIPAFTSVRYGRRCAIWVSCILYGIAGAIQTSAKKLFQLIVGRIIVGLSLGSVSTAVPAYIAELAPAKWRGTMQALWTQAVVTSQFVSYGIVGGLSDVPQGWRGMIGIPIFAAVVLFFALFFVPEPPQRQILLGQDHDSDVRKFYKRSFPSATDENIDEKMKAIRDSGHHTGPKTSPWRKLINTPQARRKLYLACFLTVASQFTGFNSLMFYSTTLLKTIGFQNAEVTAIPIAGANFLGTSLFIAAVRRVGRRKLTIYTLPWIVISCVILAVSWTYLDVDYKGFPANPDAGIGWPAKVIYAFMIVFVLAYSLAIGNIAWAASELFPTEVRPQGAMVITMSNWLSNIIIASTFLTQFQKTGPAATYGFYGGVNFISWILMIFIYPETQGMQLEQISSVFEHGFGVKKANEWQEARKERIKRERRIDDVV